jgi:ABC-type transporter Mla subunit MlaD
MICLTDSEYEVVKPLGRQLHSLVAHSGLNAADIRSRRPDIVATEKDLNNMLESITGRSYDIIEWFTHTTPGRTELNKLLNS